MSKYGHTPVPRYIIYAILGVDDGGNDVAFVGQTKSDDLAKILRKHCNGKHCVTADDFGPGGCSPNPCIHVLEVLQNTTPSTAFRYVLAWGKCLEDSSYILLLHPKVEKMLDNLSPHTEAIYKEIAKRSISDVLNNPPDISVGEVNQTEEPSVSKSDLTQLNVRVSRDEKNLFSNFCTEKHISQREGLVSLLSNVNSDASATLIGEQREVILNQATRIKALKDAIAKGPRGANADKKLKRTLSFQQQTVREYLSRILPGDSKEPMLRCVSWKRHLASFPDYRHYKYPEGDGFAVIRLEAVCYGHGRRPAIFIWGSTLEENTPRRIRLRSYAKRDYLGIPIGGNPHSYKGAIFFVAYRVSDDGATDLCAAFPMVSFDLKTANTPLAEEQKYPSLEERIRNAAKPKK